MTDCRRAELVFERSAGVTIRGLNEGESAFSMPLNREPVCVRQGNPSGGNNYRGLYNIVIKSLGAAKKRDPVVRLEHCVDYSEPLYPAGNDHPIEPHRNAILARDCMPVATWYCVARMTVLPADCTGKTGFCFMDSPGNDMESISGEVTFGNRRCVFAVVVATQRVAIISLQCALQGCCPMTHRGWAGGVWLQHGLLHDRKWLDHKLPLRTDHQGPDDHRPLQHPFQRH